jgi:hypothetical protein
MGMKCHWGKNYITVPSPLSSTYRELGVPVYMNLLGAWEKPLQEPSTKSKQYVLLKFLGIFLDIITDW